MPLFKVTRSLNHNLVAYEPNTIHEFKESDAITELIDMGVLVLVPAQKEKDLKEASLKLDGKPLSKVQEETKTPPPTQAFCPKCESRVDILPKETYFYIPDKSDVIMKQETCAKCGSKIPAVKANAEEKKKIEGGLIQLKKIN